MGALKLDINQNTPEWLAERRKRIGSSDAPVIANASPWSTPYQLWQEKLGITPFRGRRTASFAIELGKRFEPAARALYELMSGFDFPAITLTRDDICPQIASLDGFNEERRINLEIKCVQANSPTWAKADAGFVPDNYLHQCVHQNFVADAAETHFFVAKLGRAGGDGQFCILDHRLVILPRSEELEKELMILEKGFSEMVKNKIRPPLSNADTLVCDDQTTVLLFSRLKAAKRDLMEAELKGDGVKELKAIFDEIKAEAIDLCEYEIKHHKVHAIGVDLRKDKNGVWSVVIN